MYTRVSCPPREYLSEKNLALIGIPRLFFDIEIEDYEDVDGIKDIIVRYIDNIHVMFDDCINLTLYGSNGSGKSFLTSIILKNAYRFHYSAQRTTLAKYLSTLWDNNKNDKDWEFLRRVNDVEFLVIDELGKEPVTAKGNELIVLDELMKHREEQGLPTILCTNLSLEDLKKKYGATFYSMIKQSVRLEMQGKDKRNEVFNKRKGLRILQGEEE